MALKSLSTELQGALGYWDTGLQQQLLRETDLHVLSSTEVGHLS